MLPTASQQKLERYAEHASMRASVRNFVTTSLKDESRQNIYALTHVASWQEVVSRYHEQTQEEREGGEENGKKGGQFEAAEGVKTFSFKTTTSSPKNTTTHLSDNNGGSGGLTVTEGLLSAVGYSLALLHAEIFQKMVVDNNKTTTNTPFSTGAVEKKKVVVGDDEDIPKKTTLLLMEYIALLQAPFLGGRGGSGQIGHGGSHVSSDLIQALGLIIKTGLLFALDVLDSLSLLDDSNSSSYNAEEGVHRDGMTASSCLVDSLQEMLERVTFSLSSFYELPLVIKKKRELQKKDTAANAGPRIAVLTLFAEEEQQKSVRREKRLSNIDKEEQEDSVLLQIAKQLLRLVTIALRKWTLMYMKQPNIFHEKCLGLTVGPSTSSTTSSQSGSKTPQAGGGGNSTTKAQNNKNEKQTSSSASSSFPFLSLFQATLVKMEEWNNKTSMMMIRGEGGNDNNVLLCQLLQRQFFSLEQAIFSFLSPVINTRPLHTYIYFQGDKDKLHLLHKNRIVSNCFSEFAVSKLLIGSCFENQHRLSTTMATIHSQQPTLPSANNASSSSMLFLSLEQKKRHIQSTLHQFSRWITFLPLFYASYCSADGWKYFEIQRQNKINLQHQRQYDLADSSSINVALRKKALLKEKKSKRKQQSSIKQQQSSAGSVVGALSSMASVEDEENDEEDDEEEQEEEFDTQSQTTISAHSTTSKATTGAISLRGGRLQSLGALSVINEEGEKSKLLESDDGNTHLPFILLQWFVKVILEEVSVSVKHIVENVLMKATTKKNNKSANEGGDSARKKTGKEEEETQEEENLTKSTAFAAIREIQSSAWKIIGQLFRLTFQRCRHLSLSTLASTTSTHSTSASSMAAVTKKFFSESGLSSSSSSLSSIFFSLSEDMRYNNGLGMEILSLLLEEILSFSNPEGNNEQVKSTSSFVARGEDEKEKGGGYSSLKVSYALLPCLELLELVVPHLVTSHLREVIILILWSSGGRNTDRGESLKVLPSLPSGGGGVVVDLVGQRLLSHLTHRLGENNQLHLLLNELYRLLIDVEEEPIPSLEGGNGPNTSIHYLETESRKKQFRKTLSGLLLQRTGKESTMSLDVGREIQHAVKLCLDTEQLLEFVKRVMKVAMQLDEGDDQQHEVETQQVGVGRDAFRYPLRLVKVPTSTALQALCVMLSSTLDGIQPTHFNSLSLAIECSEMDVLLGIAFSEKVPIWELQEKEDENDSEKHKKKRKKLYISSLRFAIAILTLLQSTRYLMDRCLTDVGSEHYDLFLNTMEQSLWNFFLPSSSSSSGKSNSGSSFCSLLSIRNQQSPNSSSVKEEQEHESEQGEVLLTAQKMAKIFRMFDGREDDEENENEKPSVSFSPNDDNQEDKEEREMLQSELHAKIIQLQLHRLQLGQRISTFLELSSSSSHIDEEDSSQSLKRSKKKKLTDVAPGVKEAVAYILASVENLQQHQSSSPTASIFPTFLTSEDLSTLSFYCPKYVEEFAQRLLTIEPEIIFPSRGESEEISSKEIDGCLGWQTAQLMLLLHENKNSPKKMQMTSARKTRSNLEESEDGDRIQQKQNSAALSVHTTTTVAHLQFFTLTRVVSFDVMLHIVADGVTQILFSTDQEEGGEALRQAEFHNMLEEIFLRRTSKVTTAKNKKKLLHQQWKMALAYYAHLLEQLLELSLREGLGGCFRVQPILSSFSSVPGAATNKSSKHQNKEEEEEEEEGQFHLPAHQKWYIRQNEKYIQALQMLMRCDGALNVLKQNLRSFLMKETQREEEREAPYSTSGLLLQQDNLSLLLSKTQSLCRQILAEHTMIYFSRYQQLSHHSGYYFKEKKKNESRMMNKNKTGGGIVETTKKSAVENLNHFFTEVICQNIPEREYWISSAISHHHCSSLTYSSSASFSQIVNYQQQQQHGKVLAKVTGRLLEVILERANMRLRRVRMSTSGVSGLAKEVGIDIHESDNDDDDDNEVNDQKDDEKQIPVGAAPQEEKKFADALLSLLHPFSCIASFLSSSTPKDHTLEDDEDDNGVLMKHRQSSSCLSLFVQLLRIPNVLQNIIPLLFQPSIHTEKNSSHFSEMLWETMEQWIDLATKMTDRNPVSKEKKKALSSSSCKENQNTMKMNDVSNQYEILKVLLRYIYNGGTTTNNFSSSFSDHHSHFEQIFRNIISFLLMQMNNTRAATKKQGEEEKFSARQFLFLFHSLVSGGLQQQAAGESIGKFDAEKSMSKERSTTLEEEEDKATDANEKGNNTIIKNDFTMTTGMVAPLHFLEFLWTFLVLYERINELRSQEQQKNKKNSFEELHVDLDDANNGSSPHDANNVSFAVFFHALRSFLTKPNYVRKIYSGEDLECETTADIITGGEKTVNNYNPKIMIIGSRLSIMLDCLYGTSKQTIEGGQMSSTSTGAAFSVISLFTNVSTTLHVAAVVGENEGQKKERSNNLSRRFSSIQALVLEDALTYLLTTSSSSSSCLLLLRNGVLLRMWSCLQQHLSVSQNHHKPSSSTTTTIIANIEEDEEDGQVKIKNKMRQEEEKDAGEEGKSNWNASCLLRPLVSITSNILCTLSADFVFFCFPQEEEDSGNGKTKQQESGGGTFVRWKYVLQKRQVKKKPTSSGDKKNNDGIHAEGRKRKRGAEIEDDDENYQGFPNHHENGVNIVNPQHLLPVFHQIFKVFKTHQKLFHREALAVEMLCLERILVFLSKMCIATGTVSSVFCSRRGGRNLGEQKNQFLRCGQKVVQKNSSSSSSGISVQKFTREIFQNVTQIVSSYLVLFPEALMFGGSANSAGGFRGGGTENPALRWASSSSSSLASSPSFFLLSPSFISLLTFVLYRFLSLQVFDAVQITLYTSVLYTLTRRNVMSALMRKTGEGGGKFRGSTKSPAGGGTSGEDRMCYYYVNVLSAIYSVIASPFSANVIQAAIVNMSTSSMSMLNTSSSSSTSGAPRILVRSFMECLSIYSLSLERCTMDIVKVLLKFDAIREERMKEMKQMMMMNGNKEKVRKVFGGSFLDEVVDFMDSSEEEDHSADEDSANSSQEERIGSKRKRKGGSGLFSSPAQQPQFSKKEKEMRRARRQLLRASHPMFASYVERCHRSIPHEEGRMLLKYIVGLSKDNSEEGEV